MQQVTFSGRGLNHCKRCGSVPAIETWHSGGFMCMIRCSNPDCYFPGDYPRGRNIEAVKAEWNELHCKGGKNE